MRRLPALLFLGVLVGALVAPATPAAAHTYLERSEPDADATVEQELSEVVLYFNEAVNQLIGDLEVEAPDGSIVSEGEVRIDGEQVSRDVGPFPEAGDYTVTWRIVAMDGHALTDDFTFTYAGPLATAEPDDAEDAAEADEHSLEAPPAALLPSSPTQQPAGHDRDGAQANGEASQHGGESGGAAAEETATAAFTPPRGLLTVTAVVVLAALAAAGWAIRGLVRWQPGA